MRSNNMMNRVRCLGVCGLVVVLSMPSLALAQGTSSDSPSTANRSVSTTDVYHPRDTFGERTERLLELQRSGRIASARRQTLSGDVQSRVYSRYVESFSHAIPDAYIDLSFGE